ncbi:MAG: hypothetical protein H7318_03935 [Oligoflexus sp.]|nr:hypothetical protein [Oligoflexus sp.]
MSNKTTISCEENLADVELVEGLAVLVQDSGKVFRCITGYDGRLTWKAESSTRYDFPEAQLQLQEIAFEDASVSKMKKVVKTGKITYLH